MATKKKHPSKTNIPDLSISGGMYEIKIQGSLEDHWSNWFEGMTLKRIENGDTHQGCTILSGQIMDQPALHGLLAKIRDLNLTLISVYRIDPAKKRRKKISRRRKPID
jgi:hypothetical protein